jgi:beta-N-acetylhexosaminidase
MLICGWQGETAQDCLGVNEQAAALIDELEVGGVILMGRNVDTPLQLRETLAHLQSRAAALGLPGLFVTVDQEGGCVSRLTPPHFRGYLEARQIGLTADPAQARRIAASMGEELREVGVNWNFAPVLDVDSNPNNPVIGARSYGPDPELVAAMGAAAVRGFQEDAGIMACGKHFPGHGDTDVDSHRSLPRVAHSIEHLNKIELAPFCAAIHAGLAAIMSSHIVFDALDPDLPATLSPRILTGLLRGKLEFDGVIITDCVEMKGVADGWGEVEAAVLAVIAGADIVLCCHTWETQRAVRDGLVAAVQSGLIPQARIDDALARIASAKRRWLS